MFVLYQQFDVIKVQRIVTKSVEAYFQNSLIFEDVYHIDAGNFSTFDIYCLVIAQQYIQAPIRIVRTANQSMSHAKLIASKLGYTLIEALPNQQIAQLSNSSSLPMPRAENILENAEIQITTSDLNEIIIGALACIFEKDILNNLNAT